MASERFAFRDESYCAFLNCKAPPVVSERHTIIEDCSGMQFHYSKTTDIYSKPPLPHPPRAGYYPQPVIPSVAKREVPHQTARKPITSDEAARRFGGFVITEFRTKKQYRA